MALTPNKTGAAGVAAMPAWASFLHMRTGRTTCDLGEQGSHLLPTPKQHQAPEPRHMHVQVISNPRLQVRERQAG